MTGATDKYEQLQATLAPFLHPDFYFVNIGANDGITSDPIHPFIGRFGWRGLAVEPVPHVFRQLEENYRRFGDRVTLVNAAVSDVARPIWFVPEDSGWPEDIIKQIGSIDRSRVEQTIRELYEIARPALAEHDVPAEAPIPTLEVAEVPCIGFNELMESEGVEHIDFLNIDTEGLDFEIFSSIDLDRFCPSVLCIEVAALTPEHRRELVDRLAASGLKRAHSFGPFAAVFVRRSDGSSGRAKPT